MNKFNQFEISSEEMSNIEGACGYRYSSYRCYSSYSYCYPKTTTTTCTPTTPTPAPTPVGSSSNTAY